MSLYLCESILLLECYRKDSRGEGERGGKREQARANWRPTLSSISSYIHWEGRKKKGEEGDTIAIMGSLYLSGRGLSLIPRREK